MNEKNFRTDNVFVWQKRGYTKQNLEAAAEIAMHLDERKYLDLMFENGSFGVQTFSYNDKVFSRDLIDSCIELNYLSKFFPTGVKRIIDIGAGYGRFTYRALEVGFIEHAVCIDANPKATLVSNIFLDKEIARNKVNILGVDSVADLPKFTYDLAVNIHSFSEMSLQAVESWIRTIRELGVPWLFVVPNPPNLALNDKTSFEGTLRHYGFEVFSSRKKYGEHALESIAMHPSTFYLLRRSNNL